MKKIRGLSGLGGRGQKVIWVRMRIWEIFLGLLVLLHKFVNSLKAKRKLLLTNLSGLLDTKRVVCDCVAISWILAVVTLAGGRNSGDSGIRSGCHK